jgi:hypothetical protein
MKISRIVIAALLFSILISAMPVSAQLPLPHSFYGDVTIGGQPAPVGTVVSSRVNGVESGNVTTWEEGRYGWGRPGVPDYDYQANLLVQGEHISSGDTIEFYVDGVKADQIAEFQSGEVTELDLTAEFAPALNQVEYWAVVVGLSDYPGTVNDLPYSAKDAQDVRNALLTSDIWSSNHITLLTDDDATKVAIKDAIDAVVSVCDSNDLFFFFFSGHGFFTYDHSPIDEDDNLDEYLCPYDFSPNRILDDELGQWLGELPTTKVAVAIDSCFSGGMIKSESEEVYIKSLAIEGNPQVGDGFAKDLDDVLQGVILTACEEAESAWELLILRNSIFTNMFTEGLWHSAADANGNGQISMEETYDYLYPRVVAVSEGDQHPQMLDNYPGELKILGTRMPDLIISSVAPDPISATLSQEIALGVTIENIGDEAVMDLEFRVDIYRDSDTAPETTDHGDIYRMVDYLGPDECETIPITISYDSAGVYQLWVQVDTDNTVVESNEDNNVYGPVSVTVLYPELSPHLRADKTEVSVGELVTFSNLTTGGVRPYTKAEWDFNADGVTDLTRTGSEASVMADVTYAYNQPGVYTVRLWMTDSLPQTRFIERLVYIEVSPCVTRVQFVADKTQVEVGEFVTFENLSTSCAETFIKAEWDFNADGVIDKTLTGTEAEVMAPVTWFYSELGVYTVRLWMTDSTPTTRYGERPLYITVGEDGIADYYWTSCTAGFFPMHLPDSYDGQVVLSDLDLADIPAQVTGVWWHDCAAMEWKYWVPGVGGDLTTLTGQFHDYMVLVTDACSWEIPLLPATPTPTPTLPTISCNPSSLSFTATHGGSNPPSKTLGIWNSGGGTLNWSASDSANWLTVNPTSGSSAGEVDYVTVQATISGMAVGVHTSYISITATNAINTPQIVPVSLTILSPQTPTPTPTVLFSDDFSNPSSGWFTYSDIEGSAFYQGGWLHVRDNAFGVFSEASHAGQYFTDFVLEVETKLIDGTDDNWHIVRCRLDQWGNGYFLDISADGYYEIQKQVKGKGVTNLIHIECIGSTLSLSVNGHLLSEVTDYTFTGGDIALGANSCVGSQFTEVAFDNIVVTSP